ncbi:MAG TPA: family 2 encapsulin nanocompartment cargo protein terpene cyclase [Actinocrinis sp.]|nr:family 2 encapsulin nanocompartment cargo protein terpene cyclase [Actinocrinis sp.]
MQATHQPGLADERPPAAEPAAIPRAWLRPTGLGTSAALVPRLETGACTGLQPPTAPAPRPPGVTAWSDPTAYAERPWGDGSSSPLYCPRTVRIDDALAAEVDARLIAWAAELGCDDDELAALAKVRFGRLVTLAHADVADPDALLVAAQMNTAWWAADDYYADSPEAGADPTLLPQRLALAMAAMDPLPPAGDLSSPLDAELGSELVLRMLSSATAHLSRHASPSQVQRACYATFSMFVSWNAYGGWRQRGTFPTAWEYLAARQHDTFYTSMTLLDPVGAYELPSALFYDPRVRRALFQAGTASVLVNDLFSVEKDEADGVCNLVTLIAADGDCSLAEAKEITVALHNDYVREFEATHREVAAVPSPELQRFMLGVRAWMGGGFEWHATNPRYAQSADSGSDAVVDPGVNTDTDLIAGAGAVAESEPRGDVGADPLDAVAVAATAATFTGFGADLLLAAAKARIESLASVGPGTAIEAES